MLKTKKTVKQTARLVLGGGAAYGLAEIGVLEVLRESFEIIDIIGTSMGAVIGALFACGKSPAEILEIAGQTKKLKVFNPLNLDKTFSGIFDGKVVLKLFEELTGNQNIENCQISYKAVSYDLQKLNTVILDKGSLAKAMRASSSIPYLFSPFNWGNYSFVDGGIEFPLPLGLPSDVKTDVIVAVNVLPVKMQKPETFVLPAGRNNRTKFLLPEVFLRSIFQNQAYMAMHSIIDNTPDLVIDAWYPEGSVFGFGEAETYYHWGIAKARQALSGWDEPNYLTRLRRRYKSFISLLNSGLAQDVQ
jgi:NTE family protein